MPEIRTELRIVQRGTAPSGRYAEVVVQENVMDASADRNLLAYRAMAPEWLETVLQHRTITTTDWADDAGRGGRPMSLDAIAHRYGVPVYRGRRVAYEGRLGAVVSAWGHHLRLRLDDDGGRITGPYHPLWNIDYLDGIDHGAAYDRREEAFVDWLAGATSGRI